MLRSTITLFALLTAASCGTPASEPSDAPADSPRTATMTQASEGSVYALTTETLSGETVDLAKYAGGVTVFVNVASECGYTPQYADLQKLHEELGGADLHVVGVPSNDFGGQEPGSATEIATFCKENYGVTFDMLAKRGTKAGDDPLMDRLAELTGERPSWNFCKYVVSPDGTEARFFKSGAKPMGDEVRGAIDALRAN